jgi:hypothetical protein
VIGTFNKLRYIGRLAITDLSQKREVPSHNIDLSNTKGYQLKNDEANISG